MAKLTENSSQEEQPLFEPDTATAVEAENEALDMWTIMGKNKTIDPTLRIPQTSPERQQAAAHDRALDTDALLDKLAPKGKPAKDEAEKTVLYLAYGSNMCAKTFRKSRGITPISQVNVCVPGLSLTFDLPGIPYFEPCFAGTKYRDPGAPSDPEKSANEIPATPQEEKTWSKPLVGIVYEVTLSDYAHIMATEGGGSSYIDVVVDCHPFTQNYDPADPVPQFPTTAPFKAHTLLSPSAKQDVDKHTHSPETATATANGIPPSSKTKAHKTRDTRPDPTHAQPSLRYKNLLVTGAREHDLPTEYRAYLSSVGAFRVTTLRQRGGQLVTMVLWMPALIAVMMLGRGLADERGKAPGWVAVAQRWLFSGIWGLYDGVLKGVFGEGERTVGENGGVRL
ncbi:hypothetical protein FQN50_009815 [Emmonsiellopsis sp. PD_5]|nr:hypothetical protein FQN50_009815 [Emmonsiellopsis sp. PD_5]